MLSQLPSDQIKLELHYYLEGKSHSMNAMLRNECEKELLKMFNEVVSVLEIDVLIESEAYSEGGLKEKWKLLGKHSPQLTLIAAVLAIVLSRIPVENKELVNLQIENLKLDNEIKKKEIKTNTDSIKDNSEVTPELVEKVVEALENNYKLVWHRSNFYKKLNFYPKVEKISTSTLDVNNAPVSEEKTVLKQEFGAFILRSDKFPQNIDDEAIIEIISPVLKKGDFQWKGFYKSEIIGFKMKDKDFKKAVANKQIEFVNGFTIKCVLHQSRKIDDMGVIQIVKNEVITVVEIIINNKGELTEQGKKHKAYKESEKRQTKLDLDSEE
jgi:hypothetical protein